MTPSRRQVILFLALAATLVAAWLAPKPEMEEGVALAPAASRRSPPVVDGRGVHGPAVPSTARGMAGADAAVLMVHPRGLDEPELDEGAFGAAPWVHQTAVVHAVRPAAPAASGPVTVEPAQAPPLPFQVLGRYEESGKAAVFLMHGEQSLVVRVGDTFAKDYKAEKLSDTTLSVRYLPMNLLQELSLGKPQ